MDPLIVKVIRQTPGCLDHDGTVHSVWPGTNFTPEPGGAEVKAGPQSIRQSGLVFGCEESFHFGNGDRVGITVNPLPGCRHQSI